MGKLIDTQRDLSTKEVADLLNLKLISVQKAIQRGALKAELRGRDYWIAPAEVERYRVASLGRRGRRK